MGDKFAAKRDGHILVRLLDDERALLARVVSGLDSVEANPDDPGHARLHPPVYLGDDAASSEWWRLMGDQLDEARSEDRRAFDRVVAETDTSLTQEEARSFLRVLNQSRLVFAARLGIEVAEDMSGLGEENDVVLWFLSYVVDDLSEVLEGLLR